MTGQAILRARHLGVSLFAPRVAQSLAGTIYYLAVVGVLAVALGALFRRTAAAGVVLFALVFLIPQIANALPSPWDVRLGRWMLPSAGEQMVLLHTVASGRSPAPAAWLGPGVRGAPAAGRDLADRTPRRLIPGVQIACRSWMVTTERRCT